MGRVEIGVAVVWVLLALGITAHALQLRIWERSGPGSGFVPLLAAIVLGVGGLSLLVQARGRLAAGSFLPGRAAAGRVFAVLAGLAATAILMPVLGFLVTSILVMVFLLSVIERQGWAWVVGLALAVSVGCYWLFDRILEMSLPKGPFGF